MKTRILFTAFAALSIAAQADTSYIAQPKGSSLKIDGSSNIHAWTAQTTVIGGRMDLDSNFPLDPSKEPPKDLKVKPFVEVTIPVRQLQSSGKAPMDSVMHEHMKADEFPRIKYSLIEMTSKGKTNTGLLFTAKGALTVAGVTKTNEFDVVISKVDDKIKVSGVTDLKMTDFGISPPAPKIALGAIKTADDVKITFEWLTAPKKAQ
jgi:polyisoprenoid-binding protein YceI